MNASKPPMPSLQGRRKAISMNGAMKIAAPMI